MQGRTVIVADQIFVIRLWNEAADQPGAEPAWRGRARYVNTSEDAYFDTLPALYEFIESRLRARRQESLGQGR